MKKWRFWGFIVLIMILCCNTMDVSAATLKDIFCAEYYADSYPDLKATYGYNERALYRHFLKYGIKEKRVCSPILDVVKYRGTYADLEEAFGNNWNAYVNHYFKYGIKERRDGGADFDPIEYAAAYGDIRAAFGNNYEAIVRHYLTYGMKENRTEGVITLEEKRAAKAAKNQKVFAETSVSTPTPPPIPTPTPDPNPEITCTLKVWAPSQDQAETYPWLKIQCESFAAEHPEWDITFQYGVCGESDAKSVVMNDVDSAADVFCYQDSHLQALLDADVLMEFTGEHASFVKNNFTKTYVAGVTSDEKIYGIPYYGTTWFMYYNTNIYSKEDVKSLETMLEKGKVVMPLNNAWYNPAFFLATGATFCDGINHDANINLGSNNGLKAIQYMIDLNGKSNFKNGELNDACSGLKNGTVAATFGGDWNRTEMEKALGDNFGVAALPTITVEGEECQLKNFSGINAFGVKATTEYPEVATALAVYLSSESAQLSRYEARGVIPSHNSVIEQLNDPYVNAISEVYENCSIIQPYCEKMKNWWTPAATLGTDILWGDITHDNAEEKATEFYNEINGN